jgi:hypothetical protein
MHLNFICQWPSSYIHIIVQILLYFQNKILLTELQFSLYNNPLHPVIQKLTSCILVCNYSTISVGHVLQYLQYSSYLPYWPTIVILWCYIIFLSSQSVAAVSLDLFPLPFTDCCKALLLTVAVGDLNVYDECLIILSTSSGIYGCIV